MIWCPNDDCKDSLPGGSGSICADVGMLWQGVVLVNVSGHCPSSSCYRQAARQSASHAHFAGSLLAAAAGLQQRILAAADGGLEISCRTEGH